MITAKEALTLVETSSALMDKRLERLDKLIQEAARLGKRSITLHRDAAPYTYSVGDEFKVEHRPYQSAEFTPLQRQIKAELEKFGYAVKIVLLEVQIGGGLGSMDDEVREEDRPYFQISW